MRVDAQQPDSSRKDSSARARADSTTARDSAILAREMLRIRREPRAHDTTYAPPVTPQARPTPTRSGRIEVGVAHSSVLVDDANGITVRMPWSPALGLGLAWEIAPATRLVLAGRVSTAPVQVRARYDQPGGSSTQWSAGRSWTVDGLASVEHDVWPGLSIRGGVGLLALRGPDDVAPFSTGGIHAVAEAGLSWRLPVAAPLFATVAAQGYRAGGANEVDPVHPGTVARVIVGLRRGL